MPSPPCRARRPSRHRRRAASCRLASSSASFVPGLSLVVSFAAPSAPRRRFIGSRRRGTSRPALTSASVGARPKIRRYAFWIRARVVRLARLDAPREQLALLLHEVAVHEEQPLQRHGGGEALLGGEIRAREIEQLQVLVELVAADFAVDRARDRRAASAAPTARPASCRARPPRTAASRASARPSCAGGSTRQYSRLPESLSKFAA